MPQETYCLLSLGEDVDEDRDANTRYAPFENMLSAAEQVGSLLVDFQQQTKSSSGECDPSLCYCILGGFSMQLRGGRQSTRDIDFATSIKMKGVWMAVTGQDQIVIPDSRLIEGVLKIFVKTGSPWDACEECHRIEVDIKQAGFRGSPRNLHDNVERVGPFDLWGQAIHLNLLRIPFMIRIKVECCLTREEQRDFDDVRFMLQYYPELVTEAIRHDIVEEDDLLEVLQHAKIGDEHTRQTLTSSVEKMITQAVQIVKA